MDSTQFITDDFWKGDSITLFSNPKKPIDSPGLLAWAEKQNYLKSHLLIPTSGTTGEPRWIALSKQAMLSAAKQVNQAFAIDSQDILALNLPLFHVSGLGILARGYLAKCSYHDLRNIDKNGNIQWDAQHWSQQCKKFNITIASLVPTQVADLVNLQITCPKSIRIIFVGGDYLSPELAQQAAKLNWPLHQCYGMTETSAMLAVEHQPGAGMTLLPNWSYQQTSANQTQFKGDSLCSGYIAHSENKQQWEFKSARNTEGWFTCDDYVEFDDQLQVKSIERQQNIIKILGEKISLSKQISELQTAAHQVGLNAKQAQVTAQPHSRRGAVLIPIWENIQQLDEKALLEKLDLVSQIYHKQQATRITELEPWKIVDKLECTSLNKIILNNLA